MMIDDFISSCVLYLATAAIDCRAVTVAATTAAAAICDLMWLTLSAVISHVLIGLWLAGYSAGMASPRHYLRMMAALWAADGVHVVCCLSFHP